MFRVKALAAKIFLMRSFAKAKASVTVGGVLMGGYGHHRRLEVKFMDYYIEKKVNAIVKLYNSGPNVKPLTVEEIATITSKVREQGILEETTCLKAEYIVIKGFKGAISVLYDISET
jgi:hypothetical protein